MNNPFEDAQGLVGDLQGQYDTLAKAIPKLKAAKEAASEDLQVLNKQLVDAQATLEQLQERIAANTIAYNEWQQGQLAELKTKRDDFVKLMASREADLVSKAATVGGQVKAVELAQDELSQREARLKKDREVVTDRQAVNDKWAETLAAREGKLKQREDDIALHNLQQEARDAELSQREAKIVPTEAALTEAVRRSELDRQTAKKLLDDAKDTIANNDAKQQELELREKFLKNKEADLHNKEVALNDRASVIASH